MNTNTYNAVCRSSIEYVDNLRSRLNLRNGSVLSAYEYDQQESASNPITAEGSKRLMDSLSSGSVSHYGDLIMGTIASQITSLTIVYSTVYSDADQRKHQSSASLAFVWGIHRGPVNSPRKWPVTRKMFPFDDVIMQADNVTAAALCRTHAAK